MDTSKLSAARIARVWLDLVLVLLLVIGPALVGWFLLAPWFLVDDFQADVSVEVDVGSPAEIPFVAVVPLELAGSSSGPTSEILRATLVKGQGELRVVTTSRFLHYGCMLSYVVALLAVAWAVWCIRGVVATTLEGRPFDRGNVARLRSAGIVVMAGSLVWATSQHLLAGAVLSRVEIADLALEPGFHLSPDAILGGLLLLVLAAVFSHGADLEDDAALTV